MIRKKKKYSKPRKPYEKIRIKEEDELVKKYGLKNKREIWKTLAKIKYFRNRAKELARHPIEEQQVLFSKLNSLGLKAENTSNILDLKVEDFMNRRLSTIVGKNKMASTIKQARQLIVHKKVLISGKIVNSPGYLVPVAEENLITLKNKKVLNEQKIGESN